MCAHWDHHIDIKRLKIKAHTQKLWFFQNHFYATVMHTMHGVHSDPVFEKITGDVAKQESDTWQLRLELQSYSVMSTQKSFINRGVCRPYSAHFLKHFSLPLWSRWSIPRRSLTFQSPNLLYINESHYVGEFLGPTFKTFKCFRGEGEEYML